MHVKRVGGLSGVMTEVNDYTGEERERGGCLSIFVHRPYKNRDSGSRVRFPIHMDAGDVSLRLPNYLSNTQHHTQHIPRVHPENASICCIQPVEKVE